MIRFMNNVINETLSDSKNTKDSAYVACMSY